MEAPSWSCRWPKTAPLPAARTSGVAFCRARRRRSASTSTAGSDSFVASGRSDGITVRVAGGAGEDRLDDSHGGGTHFYDADASEVAKGPGTGVSTWEWTRVPYKKETPWMEKKDFGSLTLMQPLVWWEPDPGVVLSFGATRYGYGFRKQPYSTMQHVALEYKAGRTAFGASYTGDFRWSRPGLLTLVELDAEGAKNYNFYGFGNESPEVEDEDDELVEAHQDVFEGFVSVVGYENRRRTFGIALGPHVSYSEDDSPPDSVLGTEQPYGFGNFGQVGARLRVDMNTRGRLLVGDGRGRPDPRRQPPRYGPRARDRRSRLSEGLGRGRDIRNGLWSPHGILAACDPAQAGGPRGRSEGVGPLPLV